MSICTIIDHGRKKPVSIEEFDEIVTAIYTAILDGVTHFCGCGHGTVVNKSLRLLFRIKKSGYTKLAIKRYELSQKEIEVYMKNSYRYPETPTLKDTLEFAEKMWVNVSDYIIVGKNRGYKIDDSDLKKLLKSKEKFITQIPHDKKYSFER